MKRFFLLFLYLCASVIVLADDLAPSETVQMDKEKILSFVTVHGSVNSHTAILARTMSIPALVGTDLTLSEELNGQEAIVDGFSGTIYIQPDEKTREELELYLFYVDIEVDGVQG